MTENDPPYTQAVVELESILEELESGDIDIDALPERVRRAAELVAACRRRLAAAELEIEQVLAEVGSGAAERGDTDAPPATDDLYD